VPDELNVPEALIGAEVAETMRELGIAPLVPPDEPDDIAALRARAAQVANQIAPDAKRWDEEERFPERSWRAIVDAGLNALSVPERYGGEGRGVREACVVLEELAHVCFASALATQMYLNGPPRAILRLGTEEQHERYLPGTASGERAWAIAISEPWAGSSATELRCEAAPDGEGFRLSGTKCYITNAARATSLLVFCRLPGTTGAKGIGALVVEQDANGMQLVSDQPKMGGRGVPEYVLGFEEVRIDPQAVILAPQADSSRGAAIMLKQFNPERCGNSAMCLGAARAALELSLVHLRRRRQFGREIAEFQGLQWKVVDMACKLDAARMMLMRAAESDDDGFPSTRYTSMAKVFVNESAEEICREAIQIHGHWGYTRDLPLERFYRDVRGMTLGGGTSEIMRNVAAGELLGRRFPQTR
jgi:hypothetical protein